MKKILLHTVIRHKYVGESVAIIIGECYSQSAPFLTRDAGALADIGKSSIAVVVIKNVGSGGEIFPPSLKIEIITSSLSLNYSPLHLTADKQTYIALHALRE